jgi:hypothetical protein
MTGTALEFVYQRTDSLGSPPRFERPVLATTKVGKNLFKIAPDECIHLQDWARTIRDAML